MFNLELSTEEIKILFRKKEYDILNLCKKIDVLVIAVKSRDTEYLCNVPDEYILHQNLRKYFTTDDLEYLLSIRSSYNFSTCIKYILYKSTKISALINGKFMLRNKLYDEILCSSKLAMRFLFTDLTKDSVKYFCNLVSFRMKFGKVPPRNYFEISNDEPDFLRIQITVNDGQLVYFESLKAAGIVSSNVVVEFETPQLKNLYKKYSMASSLEEIIDAFHEYNNSFSSESIINFKKLYDILFKTRFSGIDVYNALIARNIPLHDDLMYFIPNEVVCDLDEDMKVSLILYRPLLLQFYPELAQKCIKKYKTSRIIIYLYNHINLKHHISQEDFDNICSRIPPKIIIKLFAKGYIDASQAHLLDRLRPYDICFNKYSLPKSIVRYLPDKLKTIIKYVRPLAYIQLVRYDAFIDVIITCV